MAELWHGLGDHLRLTSGLGLTMALGLIAIWVAEKSIDFLTFAAAALFLEVLSILALVARSDERFSWRYHWGRLIAGVHVVFMILMVFYLLTWVLAKIEVTYG